MISVNREDTQWAIAGKVATTALEQLAHQLPKELQGDGSKIVTGKEGFAALLVFGDLPDETLAEQLLSSVTPVYLLDFDDDAPVTLRLDRKMTRIIESRVDDHPADFLDARGIVAPGYALTPPVKAVSVVEGASLDEAKRTLPPDAEVELREHQQGVLFVGGVAGAVGAILAAKLGKRGYIVHRDPEGGWFRCVLCEPGEEPVSYSPVRPDPNRSSLDNILGETTLEGILRVLAIPGELLGLDERSL